MKALLISLLLFLVPAAAVAACPSYPYTLTNGQTADANQVMANLNSVRTCANNAVTGGPNSSITSLSGLTTPLSIPQGGTGATTGSGALSALGGLLASNNLTDVSNSATALTNLGGLAKANNLADVANSSTALANILPSQTGHAGQFLGTNGAVATWTSAAPAYAEFQEKQNSGVASSCSLTINAWTARILNTTLTNTISGASLGSNQIVLPAGTYVLIESGGFSGAGGSGFARTRVRNVTDSATINAGFATDGAGSGVPTPNNVQATFVLASTKTLEIDTFITAGSGAQFCGTALTTGDPEVYTDVIIEKIA